MRPTEEELQECYKLVRDVTGKINDEGGIEIERIGHFKDFIHKMEVFFWWKFYNEGKIKN